ncbi:MAG: acetyltransferase [Myxococcota bacterium]
MRSAALALAAALLAACAESPALVPEVSESVELAVGETRTIELRHTRFDVEGFVKENTLDDLRRMPRRVLEDIWLLDLDITPLTSNALEQLRDLEPAEAEALPLPARNMRTLLKLTPDNVVLEGTNFEELQNLSSAVGIPTARAFGNLLEVEVTDEFVPPEIVAEVIADNIIGTHPNAQTRRGPVNAEHPDGLYPVAPRSLPLTMADVVTNFEGLSERFGPTGDHPGFITAAAGVSVIEEEFKMRSRVNVNALPFKGVDLGDASVASVSSVGSQVETLHDFSQDDWLELEGLVEDPRVQMLTLKVEENPTFIPGGVSRMPEGKGDSPVWANPSWEFETVLAEMSRRTAEGISDHCDEYELATGAVAFSACIDGQGWVTMETFNNIGSPPDPSYLWDINLEIGQVRVHDGGLAEGEADVEFTVQDVPVGVPPDQMVAQLQENIQANPEALREFAELLIDNARGNADFFYRRGEDGTDWLFFVEPEDIQLDEVGDPVRGYDYGSVGFFGDQGLSERVSTDAEVDGDVSHQKVAVEAGDVVFVADDAGAVYRLDIGEKPGRARVSIDVTRVR